MINNIFTEGIKYIGSKRLIIPHILDIVRTLDIYSVCDLFTGTTRVSQALKQCGYMVITNDFTSYSKTFANCYIVNNSKRQKIQGILDKLNSLEGKDGWFSSKYAGGAQSIDVNPIMFWQRHNTEKLDAIREKIEEYGGLTKDILLSSLILAMDKVDNTVGVQQAFLKNSWSKRSYNTMRLEMPKMIIGKKGLAYKQDATKLASKIFPDLFYLDPPYTTHNYYSYYHIWETIIRNDAPEVYGITNRRKDTRQHKSLFNSIRTAKNEMKMLLEKISSHYILISYNNEGIIPEDVMIAMCQEVGHTMIRRIDYKRNVMCDIGRFGSDGKRRSEKNKIKNMEYLFLIEKS